jgi:hypothetical protein
MLGELIQAIKFVICTRMALASNHNQDIGYPDGSSLWLFSVPQGIFRVHTAK